MRKIIFLGVFLFPLMTQAAEKKVDLTTVVLNHLFSSIGRPHLEFRLDFKFTSNRNAIHALNGRFDIPFIKPVQPIPLTESQSNEEDSSDLGRVRPYLNLDTQGLNIQWTVDTHSRGGHQVLSNDIQFINKKGQSVPLIVTARSELTDFIQISLYGIRLEFSGIEAETGKVSIDGSCNASQISSSDLNSDSVNFEKKNAVRLGRVPVTCSLQGYVYKNKNDYEFNLVYDNRKKRE